MCPSLCSEGDADLYVSDVHTNPTFEFEEHVSSSATCGVDTVALPPTMGRPINIAVYGYPRYEVRRRQSRLGKTIHVLIYFPLCP